MKSDRTASRKERLCAITATLIQNPNKLFSLSAFAETFGAAKSTLSEDIAIIKESLEQNGKGELQIVLGAAGGVRYLPLMTGEEQEQVVRELLERLSDPARILPGGFIYTADIFLTPGVVDQIARLLWQKYAKTSPDIIVTVEVKGIPLAMRVATLFDKPLVVIRKENKLTEGSGVTLNYLSGSSRRMQTMSLSKRAVKEGQKALVIDDFLAGGGTLRAIFEMMKEFSITVVGCGVAISTRQPVKKKVENYKSVVVLEEVDEENGRILLSPGK